MTAALADLGAGFSTASQKAPSTGKELQHGNTSQFARALAMGSYFLAGVMAVNISQFIGAPMYLINKEWYNAWIALTKQSVGLLLTTMTQFWAPTTVIISGDKSMRGQLLKTVHGNLYCDFPERLVFIANHQIYTDWLYIWWLAYTSGLHGRIYIVLKESLKRIPLIGWGMQFSKFIFLKRNWEHDKPNLARHMKQLNNRNEPMWLTLFPEGTNLAPSTRRASAKWAEKQGLNDLRHALLPRSTGLRFMLGQLRETVDWVYDCTIAYEGVPRGQFAQDIYTLRAMYAGGRAPESVSMHFRRFHLSTIPLDDANAFEKWLRSRWTEKDNLLEHYLQHGYFPADSGAEQFPDGKIKRGSGHIKTKIRANKWYEFLQVFAPLGLFAMVLYTFYGALPKKFVKAFQRQAILNKIDMVRKTGQQAVCYINKPKQPQGPYGITNHQLAILKNAMTQKNIIINQETIQKALEAGFFKPKTGGSNRLAITDEASPQIQAVNARQKSGLTAAEKRSRARHRQTAVAASTPTVTNRSVTTSQPNEKTTKPKAAPSISSQPKSTARQVTHTAQAIPNNKPLALAPQQKACSTTKFVPTAAGSATKGTSSLTPSSRTPAKHAQSTASNNNPLPRKNIPKLGPPSSSESKSVASTTSSKHSIPKLEIRSKKRAAVVKSGSSSSPISNTKRTPISTAPKPNTAPKQTPTPIKQAPLQTRNQTKTSGKTNPNTHKTAMAIATPKGIKSSPATGQSPGTVTSTVKPSTNTIAPHPPPAAAAVGRALPVQKPKLK